MTIADLMQRGIETTDDARLPGAATKYLKEELDEEAFEAKQKAAFQGKLEENTVLANFRVMVSTSSQMINHSTFKTKGNKTSDAHGCEEADRRLRMSLTLRTTWASTEWVGGK